MSIIIPSSSWYPAKLYKSDILVLAKGDVVYSQHDLADTSYEVLDGLVRTCRFYYDGRRQLTNFHFHGDVFGWETGRYWSSAEVVTETTRLRRLDRPSVDLDRALQRAEQRNLLLGQRTAGERVAAFLLMVAERYQGLEAVPLAMPREDIGDYLALTVETGCRMMRALARRRTVDFDGPHRFRILDSVALALAPAGPPAFAFGA